MKLKMHGATVKKNFWTYFFQSRPKRVVLCIQDVSREKVNILGGDGMGHCKKKHSYEHVSNSKCLPR